MSQIADEIILVGDIMTEFPYPECTTSSITALAHFRKHNSTYRSADIEYVLFPVRHA